MDIPAWQVIAVFFLAFGASLFSGMAGGGGGFIILPVLIAMGLSPQQAVATMKVGGFGLITGSVTAFRGKAFANRKLLIYLTALAFMVSLFVPHIFRQLNGHTFQIILGVLLLVLIPVVLKEKAGLKERKTTRLQKIIGSLLMIIVLFLQGIFSGGVGSLNNILLISFFGLTVLEANAMRRVITLALNAFIVLALIITTHFIVYKLAISGLVGSFIGGYIGSEIAIKEGERFAQIALAVFMAVSGVWLLATA